MSLADLAAIAETGIRATIGEPSRASLPDGCPVSIFVCAVTLPEGCLSPPGPMPRRIGAGAALDQDVARDLCLLEGIERYSLQYREGDPDEIAPTGIPGCRQAWLPAWRLRLGHPAYLDGRPLADSRGCASGGTLADAALRGLMELAEHDGVDAWHRGDAQFRTVDERALDGELYRLVAWARSYGLRLRLLRHHHRSGAVVCIGICTDGSGKRPAIGSAAGLAIGPTELHACLESLVTWFNLDAIERGGASLDEMAPEALFDIEIWRGLRVLPAVPEAENEPVPPAPTLRDSETAFAEALTAWGIDVAVFDLSRVETGIVTARVVRLDD